MILSDSELDAVVQTAEGSLEKVPFAVLLFALARAERSASLTITRQPKVKQIIIERGVPGTSMVGWASTLNEAERLEVLLYLNDLTSQSGQQGSAEP